MRPYLCSRMWRVAGRMTVKWPFRCTAMTEAHSFSHMLKVIPIFRIPTQPTTMSRTPRPLASAMRCCRKTNTMGGPTRPGRSSTLCHADQRGQAIRIGAERGRLAVVHDATLVHHHGARREGERDAAVLLDQHDRERALPAQA